MKIAIDGRSLTSRPTGVANYLINALNSMTLNLNNYKFYLFVHKNISKEAEERIVYRENLEIIKEPFFIFKDKGLVWYLLKASRVINELNPDYFWAPATLLPPFLNSKIKTIVTVHDLVYKEFNDTMAFTNKISNYIFADFSIKKADFIWSVSNYTKKKLSEHFPGIQEKDIFVGSSIDKELFRMIQLDEVEKNNFLENHNLNNKFLLFVGTLEPRKNLKFLLSLMTELSKLGYKLFVVGCKGWGDTEIKKIVENEKFPKQDVIFAGYLKTEELIKAYNLASVYVSTSCNEGFGLPQLEAMSCGCPVVTAHNSAMIEVVEGAGITVKGWGKKDWINSIEKVYNNRNIYKRKCLKRANEYNWENIINNFEEFITNG